jgi:transketolase-like protein
LGSVAEGRGKEQPVTDKQIEQLAINTIRTLSIDAIQQANSGQPGTPMGMAPLVYCLWQHFLRFDPEDPICEHDLAEPVINFWNDLHPLMDHYARGPIKRIEN